MVAGKSKDPSKMSPASLCFRNLMVIIKNDPGMSAREF